MSRKRYPSDLTDEQWQILEPLLLSLLPKPRPNGRQRTVDLREVVNTLRYQQRSGCQWDMLPHDLLARSTVFDYYDNWRKNGIWQTLMDQLREKVRTECHPKPATDEAPETPREATPSAACIDSQTVKTGGQGGEVGYDGGKRIAGRKRHIITDTLGLLLVILVTGANVDDGAAASRVLGRLDCRQSSRLEVVYADQKYRNRSLQRWMKKRGVKYEVEVVGKPPKTKGFVPLKKRWAVERTFAWLGRDRRNSRDYEKKTSSSETRIRLSMIGLMLNRLAPPSPQERPRPPFRYQRKSKQICSG